MIVPDINFWKNRAELDAEPDKLSKIAEKAQKKIEDMREKAETDSEIIIANPKLAGEKLLDKIKEELAK